MQGTPAHLYENCRNFAEIVGQIETSVIEEDEQKSNVHTLDTQSIELLEATDSLPEAVEKNDKDQGVQLEASSRGKVNGIILFEYLKTGAHWSVFLILLFIFVFVQLLGSAIDYFVSVW